ncbi:MAG TPA: hypothetical protein VMU40_07635 [Steroidobacteraceae bacterium]|nr:hypothetical protein [Steroidobacteraceae bacterium]
MGADRAAFVIGFVALAAVIVWFYTAWQTFVAAWTRQGVFELRDAWFDAVSFNENTRDLTGARRVRAFCNGVIGMAQALTWPSALMVHFLLTTRDRDRNATGAMRADIDTLPSVGLKRLAWRIVDCAALYVVAGVLARSVFAFPVGLYLMHRARCKADSICQGEPRDLPNLDVTRKRTVARDLIRIEVELSAEESRNPLFRRIIQRGMAA